MRVACPECDTAFDIPDGAIKAKGRNLRCSQCQHQWHQYPVASPPKPKAPEPAEEPEAEVEDDAAAAAGADDAEGDDAAPGDGLADDSGDDIDGGEGPGDGAEDEGPSLSMFGAGDGESEDEDGFDAPPLRHRPSFAAPPKPKRTGKIVAIAAVVVIFLVLPVGMILARASLVAAMPGFSPVFDSIGLHVPVPGEALEIRNVGVWRKIEGEVEVMLIEGEVHNDSEDVQSVPVLRATIKDKQGNELQSAPYTLEAAILLPDDTVKFRYEIPRPSPLAERVTITFSDEARQSSDIGY